ncbi:MAG: type II secretion system protein GspF [Proteobacteria bacterium]|nr:MAG: type II secretion system protein GspF [Pseudomonadota bacterium]
MPLYEYTGSDRSGANVRNSVDAESIKAAKAKVKKLGVMILSIEEKKVAKGIGAKLFPTLSGSGSVNVRQLSVSTRQFASLIKANIPLVDALSALVDQTDSQKLRSTWADVRQQVNEGISLREALARHPKVFAPFFINMVESGEASGTLPLVLQRLADFMESQVKLRQKISSAMTYPLIMALIGGGLMLGIFTFVIPKIAVIFTNMNKKLPWYTEAIMNFSFFLTNYWWALIIGAFAIVFFVRQYYSTPTGKVKKDQLMLNLPIFGDIVRAVAVTRFARTLSTLLIGGVPLVTALGIVKSVVDNEVLARAVAEARDNITEGQSISEPLKRSGQFPSLLIHMISIGERTGELSPMLEMVAENFEDQVNSKVERMTSLLEPMMIVFMGLSVGIIVMAVFVPLLQLQQIK